MQTLYMKIHAFEEQSYSLLVSFASDTTKYQDPDKYPAYAFQPMNMWPDVTDPAEIKKRIAVSGVHHAEQQEREENFIADLVKMAEYKAMVNTTDSFQIGDLIALAGDSAEMTPFIEVL